MLTATLTSPIAGLDVTFEVARRVVALIGPNGAGKTTLARTLLGGVRPRTGRITLGDRTLLDTARHIDLATAERGLGYVPQDFGLFPNLTVAGHLRFALGARGPVDPAHVARELAALGLTELADRRPERLSGGERQRVALARALAAAPEALILDEPLNALDVTSRRRVRAFLGETLRRVQLPTLLITHDVADVEALADEVLVLEAGRLTQRGTVGALRAEPATPFVAAFFASSLKDGRSAGEGLVR